MIYYFSGTGNSRWIATQIAEAIGDTAVDIAELMKKGTTDIAIKANQSVGIVFPIYAYYAPEPVVEFVRQIKVEAGAFRFAISTHGDEAGNAMERLSHIFPLDSAWSISMPNNYIIMYDLDPQTLAKQKIVQAKESLPGICEAIRNRKKVWQVTKGVFPRTKTYLVYPLFRQFMMNAKNFKVENSCISCNRCEQVCPTGCISMKNGKPDWGANCAQCLACLHHCPTQAIQFGNSTKSKGRYTFETLK